DLGRTCHLEQPCVFGATPPPKILSFDPNQFTAHRLHSTPPNLVWLCFCERRRRIGSTATAKPLFQRRGRGSAQPTTLRQATTACILTIEKCAVCRVSNADENCYLKPRSSSNCRIT